MKAMHSRPTLSTLISCLLLAAVLASCAVNQSLVPPPLNPTRAARDQPIEQGPSSSPDRTGGQVTPVPLPPPGRDRTGKPDQPLPQPAGGRPEEANITLSFDQLPLPSFIQTVYGTILKKNFTVDPAVAARSDLVTLRTGRPQTPSEVESTARMLLKSYGVAVLDLGGFLKISPDTNIQGYAPEIRRGRALPETPAALRPIFYLVEMKAVRVADVSGWLKTMFGNKLSTITDDTSRNAIMLGGLTDDVYAAMEAIEVLDQPFLRAKHGVRFNPVFWASEDFARKLAEVLSAQGYNAGTSAGAGSGVAAITVLPVQPINAVLIFAGDDALVNYTLDWAKELDKPNAKRGATTTYFVYQVRYTDANELAKTLTSMLTGSGATTGSQLPPQVMTAAERIQSDRAAAAAPAQNTGPVRNSKIVVNVATNSIIFQGTGEEYVQVQNLLKDLDRPSKTVLIEVTVAEVGLTNNENLGIEWALANQTNSHGILSGGTLPNGTTLGNSGLATTGLGIGAAGLVIGQVTNLGQTRLVLNALASNNRAKILSSPRIVARSGETATIQVGAQVPVITSTQTTAATAGGVLQSVQYLPTGVILKVKPIVYSGDRIDVEVSQEVSTPQNTTTGVSASPTISTRKIETKLAMRDGATVLLGGLMSSNESIGNTGVPLLKDIPLFGQLFRVDANQIQKTELIVLITPYVMGDDLDAQSITEAFRNRLGTWAQPPTNKPVRTLPSGGLLDLIRIPSQQEFPHSDVPPRTMPAVPAPASPQVVVPSPSQPDK